MTSRAMFAMLALLPSLAIPNHVGTKPNVLFVGDSLTFRSEAYATADLSNTTHLTFDSKIGTALCDWLPSIEALTTADAPKVVVVEFIGNHITPCIDTSPDFIAQYGADLTTAIAHLLAIGTKHVIVDRGPVVDNPAWNWLPQLLVEYQQVIATFPSGTVEYAYSADAAVEDHGKFAWTLPCLTIEKHDHRCPRDGRIAVRWRDGVHFCPAWVTHVPVGCPVYASGSFRFERAFAALVRVDI